MRTRVWPDLFTDRRAVATVAAPPDLYAEVGAIGGANGWYFMNWAWRLRGAADRLLGGPGVDSRTPLPAVIAAGDRRDFWEVIEVEPGRRLRLRALMLLPGVAELEWTVAPRPDGSSILYQTARFRPAGVLGRGYWYGLMPIHLLIFRGMSRAIAGHAPPRGRRSRPATDVVYRNRGRLQP